MTVRVHLRAPGPDEDGLSRALCGHLGVRVTPDRTAVTCRLCARRQALVERSRARVPPPKPQATVAEMDARHRRRLEERDDTTVMTPGTWQDVRGVPEGAYPSLGTRLGRHLAQIEADHDKRLRDAERNRPAYIGPHDGPRWRSIDHALAAWVAYRADGAPVKTLDPEPQVAPSTTMLRDNRSQRMVDDAVFVEHALARWTSGEHAWTPPDLVGILVARVVGEPVPGAKSREPAPVPVDVLAQRHRGTPGEIGGVVRRGKRALRVELGARGLVPMPGRASRDHEAAHQRREELAR